MQEEEKMKKIVIRNLWLMMIAWCLFLNDHVLSSMICAMMASLYSLWMLGEVNFWRAAAISISFYALMSGSFFSNNISFFFPALHIFMMAVCLNAGICTEYFVSLKRKKLMKILVCVSLCALVFLIAVILVPESDYSLFSKGNLYRMISFIFLPYLLPAWSAYLYRCMATMEVKEKQRA